MNKNRIPLIIVGVIVIALLAYLALKPSASTTYTTGQNNNSSISPFANKAEMINTKGQHVDMFIKGTFRNKSDGSTFTFTGNADSGNMSELASCAKNSNCKEVYFINCTEADSHSCEGAVAWGLNTANGPVYSGTVIKKVFSSTEMIHHQSDPSTSAPAPDDQNTFTIAYTHNGTTSDITETQTLCHGNIPFNPGYDCDSDQYSVGDKIIFNLSGNAIGTQYLANQGFTVADFLNYQYYYTPNTGDVFPVVTVQQ